MPSEILSFFPAFCLLGPSLQQNGAHTFIPRIFQRIANLFSQTLCLLIPGPTNSPHKAHQGEVDGATAVTRSEGHPAALLQEDCVGGLYASSLNDPNGIIH